MCRKLIKKSTEAIDLAYNSNEEASFLVDKAQEALFNLNYDSENNIIPWKDSVKTAFSEIENMGHKLSNDVSNAFIRHLDRILFNSEV